MRLSIFILALIALLAHVAAQAPDPDGGGRDVASLDPIQPEDPVFRARLRFKCDKRFRELDGVCTSRGGVRKLWGSTNRPQFTYFVGRSTTTPRGSKLKSAREISNIIFKQTKNIFDERGLAEIATFIGQFIDHTIVATPSNKEESLDIEIPEGDQKPLDMFKDGFLPFKRSERVRVKERDNTEFPQNSLPSAMDLANVYGPTKLRNNALRTGQDGLLKNDNGFMPLNSRFVNAPGPGPRFFLAGDHRANEHPVLTALHTLFLREHNKIAMELKALFPTMSDETLFKEAKRINEAQWQKIVFDEWYPAVTGRNLPRYKGFKKSTDPTISVTFSTAAFRVGHTMVGDVVNFFGPNNKPKERTPITDLFFVGAPFIKMKGIDGFLRGAINSKAQRTDAQVVDGLRDGLFKKVNGESDNFDLVALNIQRGRDHSLPTFTGIKTKFNPPKLFKFKDITKNRKVQRKLEEAYGKVANVEAFPGLMAEDHAPGSSFGPTLLAVWEREFRRIRDGDRFYFQQKGVFKSKEKKTYPRLKAVFAGDDIFRAMILRNTDIKESELPAKMFFAN